MSPGMSSLPGWPAHSNPSMLTASAPIDWAFTACRTATALWMTLIPAALNAATCSWGLLPAVSTIVMPLSIIAARYSS